MLEKLENEVLYSKITLDHLTLSNFSHLRAQDSALEVSLTATEKVSSTSSSNIIHRELILLMTSTTSH